MSTFDIQSIVPEGYEAIGYRTPKSGEIYISIDGKPHTAGFNFSNDIHLILRKKWTPKVGEVIAVRDSEAMDWEFDVFERLRDDGDHPIGCARDYWAECRKLTPEERGE